MMKLQRAGSPVINFEHLHATAEETANWHPLEWRDCEDELCRDGKHAEEFGRFVADRVLQPSYRSWTIGDLAAAFIEKKVLERVEAWGEDA